MDTKIWIILAAVLGTLVLLLVLTLGLMFWKRSKRRIRGFSLRAVTPLPDAEFESWRRPAQKCDDFEKEGIRHVEPVVLRNPQRTSMYEKEYGLYEYRRTPSPTLTTKPTPISPITKPNQVRRKSSVASSITDRPPTPYSPTSGTGDFSRRGSLPSRKSGMTPHSHYPSMSEASNFEFNFGTEYGSPPDRSTPSLQCDKRPLHYSYSYYGESPP